MSTIRLFALFIPVVAFVACAAGEPEEEELATTEASASCPSPVEDPDAFAACVQAKSGAARADAKGGNGNRSSSGGNAGNGGRESKSANGGSIRLGDINASGCSNLSIRCDNDGCTCSSNGGPRKSCNGNDCAAVCCSK